MDFTIKNTSKNDVVISKKTIQQVIDLLDKVDCTCVWSEVDNQYIKVQDIPDNLVDELVLKLKLA